MSKSAILPIVAVVCLALGTLTGHQVSQPLQDEIATVGATVISAVISIWGVLKNHKQV